MTEDRSRFYDDDKLFELREALRVALGTHVNERRVKPNIAAIAEIDAERAAIVSESAAEVPPEVEKGALAPRLLDTRGTTSQLQPPPTDSGGSKVEASPRNQWVTRVGHHTKEYRHEKARRLRQQARGKRALLRALGRPSSEVRASGKWYDDRAKGQEFRTENVIGCQQGYKQLAISCRACGQANSPTPIRCGTGLLCISCRGKLAEKRRARVLRAREAVVKQGRGLGLLRRLRSGGAWREQLVTLTMPHDPSYGIADRIELVFCKAWTHFRRNLKTWFDRADHAADRVHWYMAKEWTPGSDRQGHPHVHFWIWGPRLTQDLVRELWRSALGKAGFGELELRGRRMVTSYDGDLIVDVRRVKPGAGGIYEVVKYIVKDLDAGGAQLDAELYAEVYMALDGRRTQQGSRGFLQLGDFAARCDCGAVGCFQVRIVDRPKLERALPAPSQLANRDAPS